MVSAAALPVPDRIANALVSYMLYLWKTIWPVDLAVPYPYSHEWTFCAGGGRGIVAAGNYGGGDLAAAGAQPYLAVGWFWFLGTLVPVIGLVQVGLQFMADRYTYIPLIGIFIMLAWSIPAKWAAWPRPGSCGAAGAAVLAGTAAGDSLQLMHWRDSVTLFRHTVAVTQGNILAEYNLGEALAARRR